MLPKPGEIPVVITNLQPIERPDGSVGLSSETIWQWKGADQTLERVMSSPSAKRCPVLTSAMALPG